MVNVTNHAVLQKVSKYITYNPIKLLAGETIEHTLNVLLTNQAPQYVPFKNFKTCGSPTCVAGNVSNREVKVIKPEDTIGCAIRFRWELQYYVAPENNTAVFSDGVRYYNGEYYVKMPILLIDNQASTKIGVSINLGFRKVTAFYASVTMGLDLINKYRSGSASIEICKAGKVWERTVSFYDWLEVYPSQKKYVWIGLDLLLSTIGRLLSVWNTLLAR
ncbi:MAG: hypothetical protein J7J20_01870 [Desulfurococcales archaeon]|nr:hypothetical protein [Desulfurococcales archaeon]